VFSKQTSTSTGESRNDKLELVPQAFCAAAGRCAPRDFPLARLGQLRPNTGRGRVELSLRDAPKEGPASSKSPSGFFFAADCATGMQRRFDMAAAAEMKDHVYKILELVGSSEKSVEDAIQNAITRASKTIREMKWFEVVQTRGHIENGTVRHYQVLLRVGFTLEE